MSHAPIDKEALTACANCGHSPTGAFCPACGEESPHHQDLSLRHLFHDVFHELFHLDSRLFRTLKALLFHPGLLTAEYFAGRKQSYIRPLRLYLVIFGLSLFVFSLYRPVSIYDFGRVAEQEKSGKLVEVLAKKATRLKTTPEDISDRISQKWQRNVSILQLVYVFLFAGVLKLVFLDLRMFYVQHLIFALHYYAFTFLWSMLLWPLYYLAGGIDPFGKSLWVTVFSYVVLIGYLFVSLRRFYRQPPLVATYRTVILVIAGQIMFAFVIVVAILAALIQVMRS